MSALTKYDELRLKTDKQLIQLAAMELETGTCYAWRALKFAEDRATAAEHYKAAKNAYDQAYYLICLAGDSVQNEKREAESQVERLRKMIEPLSAIDRTSRPGEQDVAALAPSCGRPEAARRGGPKRIGSEPSGP
jgi:hypothetical protein